MRVSGSTPGLRASHQIARYELVNQASRNIGIEDHHAHRRSRRDIAGVVHIEHRDRGQRGIRGIQKNDRRYGRHSIDEQVNRNIKD